MIRIENLTKSYPTSSGRYYVFKDLTLEFPENKSIGIIGRNGAGKSTLIRLIAGIDRPDYGEIITDKTISWPVGLASGFQGSLTGRDNVKFVCHLYATRAEFPEKVRFVEEFAELGKYFDMPIRTYSSGMRARLGFGLSMAFKFDYYLIDEATAVGDARFRVKAERLFKSRHSESHFIMASHSPETLKSFCDIALVLGRNQKVTLYNSIPQALREYQRDEHLKPIRKVHRKNKI